MQSLGLAHTGVEKDKQVSVVVQCELWCGNDDSAGILIEGISFLEVNYTCPGILGNDSSFLTTPFSFT